MKALLGNLLFLVVATLVLACGGGDGTNVAGGGIGGTGISSGPISGFGSVFVAGTRWKTRDAEVSIDGEPKTADDLKLGMQTLVRGTKSKDGETGTATSIEVDNDVEGPISANPPPDPRLDGDGGVEEMEFTVLGQVFIADATTAFDDISLETLAAAVGEWVEVSGVPDVDGVTHATRVELKNTPATNEAEVDGVVSDLLGNGDFELSDGGLMVFVRGSGNAACEGATTYQHGLPEDGDSVEVKGVVLSDSEICADRVEVEDEIEDVDEFEIEGIVTAVVDANTFMLGDLTVITDASTLYEPAGLVVALGMEVEVEGELADGVLMAEEVEQESDVVIEARVMGSPDQNGHFVVLGLPIQVWENGGTQIEEPYGADDFVKVKAVDNGAGVLTALRVESGRGDRARIKGRVDTVGTFADGVGSFSIQGVTVDVDDSVTICEDIEGDEIPCSDFFVALEVGDLVMSSDETDPFVFDDVAHSVRFDD